MKWKNININFCGIPIKGIKNIIWTEFNDNKLCKIKLTIKIKGIIYKLFDIINI